jgi:hypothetical protein
VKRPLRTIVVCFSSFALFTATEAKAGPLGDFFRALRRATAQAPPKQRSHRRSRKQNSEAASTDASNSQASGSRVTAPPNGHNNNQAAPNDASNSQKTLGAPVGAPPNGHNVRAAKTASTTKKGRSGLLYGTPVPGKQGFVTSPFSPNSGYIDVRSFPPGTEVKDPYTGKIFLTP